MSEMVSREEITGPREIAQAILSKVNRVILELKNVSPFSDGHRERGPDVFAVITCPHVLGVLGTSRRQFRLPSRGRSGGVFSEYTITSNCT